MIFQKPRKPKWPEITWTFCPDKRGDHGPRVLGINPWIHDFTAYNLWSRPVGLLACLSMLRRAGCSISLLDCLDQTWEDHPWPRQHPFGRGRYPRQPLPVPGPLKGIPRQFARYGLDAGAVEDALTALDPSPDLVMVTSIMTYWYPGTVEAIRLARHVWPRTPIVLGGVFPSLCPDIATHIGADLVISGPLERPDNWTSFWAVLGRQAAPPLPPIPYFDLALDLYPSPAFSPVIGSRGCPYHCPYCASSILHPDFVQSDPSIPLKLAEHQFNLGVRDFAFYDDALLVRPEAWLDSFLDWASAGKIRLHTPNAVHIRLLDAKTCSRLAAAGLTTLRLGLETTDFEGRRDHKLTEDEWTWALKNIFQAGINPTLIRTYILFGLPDQNPKEIHSAIQKVKKHGIRPELALYSPIPGTAFFERACQISPYPLKEEPLFQNKSLWPCVPGGYDRHVHRRWTRLTLGENFE
ncbi:MAG: radical SAM protein [Deltaproteobacteria bacterium]|nr:radical SAM protein [Deltaproteobacteria bacterium]